MDSKHEETHNSFTAGEYRKIFHTKEYEYESFLPHPINKHYSPRDPKIPVYLEEAMRHLAELHAYSVLIPDINFFISAHIRAEAVQSSRIEGTKTDMDELILTEQDIKPERRDDWKEVQNYVHAMNRGRERMKELPVSMRLLCEVHEVLMRGVRGESQQPGTVRTAQNWIGGNSIKNASFVPPHPDDLSAALQDWEHFVHNNRIDMPNLIKIAIAHYQFETIHPFNDGNGRVGRIAILLQLMETGILKEPVLYLSDFFERHKSGYYDALTRVRDTNDLDQWILFFLSGIADTAQKGKSVFRKIIAIQKEYEAQILDLGQQAKSARRVVEYGFSKPAFSVSSAAEHLGMAKSTLNRVIGKMAEKGILKEFTGYSRNRIFVLHKYVKIFK